MLYLCRPYVLSILKRLPVMSIEKFQITHQMDQLKLWMNFFYLFNLMYRKGDIRFAISLHWICGECPAAGCCINRTDTNFESGIKHWARWLISIQVNNSKNNFNSINKRLRLGKLIKAQYFVVRFASPFGSINTSNFMYF